MVKRLFGRSLLVAAVAGGLMVAGSVQPAGVQAEHAHAGAHAAVKLVKNPTLGTIITNNRGMTLYYFTPDKAGKPTCSGGCAQAWPPAIKPKSAKFGKLRVPGKFGTVAALAGGRQITYNGWPLYTFAGDKSPGQTNGQGLENVWYVATPGLKRATATASAPAPTATCASGSYGC